MFKYIKQLKLNKSFTLIELLIVIAILALLMSIIIITLNPSEMLKKSRDTKRISSLKALNNALGIFQATKPTTSTGTAYIVYISIPDSSSTCANLSLPTLPDGYTYQCSTVANYRKTDGTGWIPVNFNSLDIGSPISSLPIDPTNTTSTNLFFTYTTGGSWELNAILESSANKLSGDNDKTSLDGGDSYSTYEIGTDLTLSPYQDTGLVGYWKFDDASGTTAIDSSGYNNTGTLTNGPLWKTSSDCKRGGCLYFGTSDYVYVASSTSLRITGAHSLSIWFNLDHTTDSKFLLGRSSSSMIEGPYGIWIYNTNDNIYYEFRDVANTRSFLSSSIQSIGQANNWYHVIATWDGTTNTNSKKIYINGVLNANSQPPYSALSDIYDIYIGGNPGNNPISGYADEARIYNRVLSASEVKALYEATK